MKKIYTTFALLLTLSYSLFATQNPGFIITKDAKIITGKVADIFYSSWKTELIFINEMGRRYAFHPAVIAGFAIKTDGELVHYESKFRKGQWQFMNVLEKGKNLSLYRSPSVKTQEWSINYGDDQIVSRKVTEYWLEYEKNAPVRVSSINYKRLLRQYLVLEPELVEKLGKKGYRYKNLQTIVQEFNQLNSRKSKKI